MSSQTIQAQVRDELRIINRAVMLDGDQYIESKWDDIKQRIIDLARQAKEMREERRKRDGDYSAL
jgi:hypothetical protein